MEKERGRGSVMSVGSIDTGGENVQNEAPRKARVETPLRVAVDLPI